MSIREKLKSAKQKRMQIDEEASPGWQAIDTAFEELYPGQTPAHYGTDMAARAAFGGNEFLDGCSMYKSIKGYLHLVTYGMTVLYSGQRTFGEEGYNGWGYEMTLKLREEKPENCLWALSMLGNLARYTYTSGKFFKPNQFVRGNGQSIQAGRQSKITALILVADTEARPQTSIYGKTEFIQLVGITESELEAVERDPKNISILIDAMKADGNSELVTDMNREKSYL